MPKFLIEREIPGAGKLTPDEIQGIASRSNGVISELNKEGHNIQWIHSFVSADKITCVYNAPDEQTLREHAMRGNFPANAITPVVRVIDPITGEKPPT
ncbi:MAG TPA: DUF4242 domain-containing protein [Gemmatimonadaceae bacterium]|nr:DUF4242 domain-containing protein [Gemmatimonadaceae bacterium]